MVYLSDNLRTELRNRFYRKLERKCVKAIYQIPGPGCGGIRAQLTRRKITNGETLEYEIAYPTAGSYRIKISQNGWLPDYLDFARYEVEDMVKKILEQHQSRLRMRLELIGLGQCEYDMGYAKTPYGKYDTHPTRLVLTVKRPKHWKPTRL